jgi:hypothetical protein
MNSRVLRGKYAENFIGKGLTNGIDYQNPKNLNFSNVLKVVSLVSEK